MSAQAEQIELSILLPVRNDGINLKIMLKILRSVVAAPHEVIVVHDTPDDDSIGVVRAMQESHPELRIVHNQLGRGVVNAIRAGVQVSRGLYVLIFAADEVGPVLAIEEMLELMHAGCDFVSCTRYAHGGRRLGGSLIGSTLSRLANKLFHGLAGSPFTDATTGIKMFRRDCFARLHLESRPIGWAVAFEMSIKAQQVGLRLGEVPIVSVDRLYGGQSSFRLGPWLAEYSRWFLWGLRHRHAQGTTTAKNCMVRIPTYRP
jgi:dolichol-phosphate mannosyltransferase